MQKSYRIKTTVGTDKNIRVNVNQDFDFLEILSLKLRQEDVYTRFCADYGVVAGRIITNGGYGVPNVTISIFVPLSAMDEDNEVISTLYPYKKPSDKKTYIDIIYFHMFKNMVDTHLQVHFLIEKIY